MQDRTTWAREEFGQTKAGDRRRTARLVRIAARLAEHKAGKVTEAIPVGAERQATYRALENPSILVEDLVDGAGVAAARRARAHPFVFVPVDGSSARLADPHGKKGFGPLGSHANGGRGLKVMSALVVSPTGEPLGTLAQQYWMRTRRGVSRRRLVRRGGGGARAQAQRRARQRACCRKPTAQKETQRWIDVVQASVRRIDEQAPQTRCWFQLDREADAWPILQVLDATGHGWTVRASWNRRVRRPTGALGYLRPWLEQQPVLGGYVVDVTPGPKRTARRAHLVLRVADVTLDLHDKRTDRVMPLQVHVVWAQEIGTCPKGEKPLNWMLLTNHPIATLEQAREVVEGYTQRWRIEEVHRTWKQGGCHVEDTQEHTEAAVAKWATLLFAVAVRIERLKYLARASPDLPASEELSPHEIRALLLLKRREKKRTETVPKTMPTLGQATRWIADLGGYTGKSSGGPPGSITIGRGFERVTTVAIALEALDDEERGRGGAEGEEGGEAGEPRPG
jgi:hypothetical protein